MSNEYGEPDWAAPGASTTVPAPASAPSRLGASSPQKADRANLIQRLLSFLNLGICAMMCSLGVLGIIEFRFSNVNEVSEIFVAIYMLVFAALLAVYELMWWTNIDYCNRTLRKNFGFLYGIKGKGFFIIFAAFISIGMQGEARLKALRYATGIMWLLTGILHIFVYFWKPHLVSNYQSPSAGLSDEADPASNV